ncbi:exported hypothetical protein [Desulfamplus magnetovallimortis]|uniref:Pilus assembly protein PilP n=1 Tax=Desulfamplus magnetovallimortis TaxID=1246637 RepID=A0A1W1HID6_9BACT|nr:pilus assembly protein PilP [Desulfamplus magnetovallimortis]SLM32193.1 exported hypothetical protein [Desulfamplus magnetovallimortis]
MINFRNKVLLSIVSTFLAIYLTACEQRKEIPEQVVQEVVSIKIPPAGDLKNIESEETDSESTPAESTDVHQVSGNVKKEISDSDLLASGGTAVDGGIEDESAVKVASVDDQKNDLALTDIPLKNPLTDTIDVDLEGNYLDSPSDSGLGDITYQSLIEIGEDGKYYSGEGKIDPFEPLLKDTPAVAEEKVDIEEEVPRRILTPLEKLDFSQIKLVAVISKASGDVAMVEESSGKGYLVNIGTYIGRNSGQVVRIERDKVVIQEQVKDYKGNVIDRFQEMKLNKLDDKG